MALTAASVLNTVSQVLLDETNTRWSAANLLTYLNEAQRQLVTLRPEAGVVTETVALAEGVKQSIPTGGRALLDVPRNYTAIPYEWLLQDHYATATSEITWAADGLSFEVGLSFANEYIQQDNTDSLGQDPTAFTLTLETATPVPSSGYDVDVKVYSQTDYWFGNANFEIGASTASITISGIVVPTDEYIYKFTFYTAHNFFDFTVTLIESTPVGTASTTEGPAVMMCQKEDLDAFDLNWPLATASGTVENFAFDERNPKLFYVYPPANTLAYVEEVYVKDPTDCASTASGLGVADQYQTALRYLTLAIAYEKEIEGANPARADFYRQAAIEALMAGTEGERQRSPNVNNQDGKIARTGGL